MVEYSDFESGSDFTSDDESIFDSMDDPTWMEDSSNTDYDISEDPLEDPIDEGEIMWMDVPPTFVPRMDIPDYKQPEIQFDDNFKETFTSELDVFLKLFPKSMMMWISSCTNERLVKHGEDRNIEIPPTDYHEIMIIIGCYLTMSYNRLPYMSMYWSRKKSLGNEAIKEAISRNRFLLVSSKLYCNHPAKPDDHGKTYYMEELVDCLKYTFQKSRSNATYQSIDETMCKCKARTSLKQYMPLKPVKKGIKIWSRCDACSGYVYDFNIYTGQEVNIQEGTLGERVVTKLCNTINEPKKDVAIIVDRFFMSVELVKKLPHALVGTCMKNRKKVPDMPEKMVRGQSKALSTSDGIICFKWQDTKEVLLMSNCHKNDISTADRRQKDGTLKTFDCPQAIVFYNEYMGGVDKSDQYSTYYDIDRKSNKWWKRVFHRLLQMAVSNSWILFQELNEKKSPLIDFLIPLSEHLLGVGKNGTVNHRMPGAGRPPKHKKFMYAIGHQPLYRGTRRRCTFCASKKVQNRTLYVCSTCDLPLCVNCFEPFHK